MALRVALRTTGKKITPYVTTAGSVAGGKRLAKHPKAKAAQKCISNNAGDKSAIRACMSKI
ncbi:MAG: hypothetical protein ACOCQD_01775 [archaeon]